MEEEQAGDTNRQEGERGGFRDWLEIKLELLIRGADVVGASRQVRQIQPATVICDDILYVICRTNEITSRISLSQRQIALVLKALTNATGKT